MLVVTLFSTLEMPWEWSQQVATSESAVVPLKVVSVGRFQFNRQPLQNLAK